MHKRERTGVSVVMSRLARMLSDDDRAILHLEESTWGLPTGVKAERIRVELGLSSARYYQRLHALAASRDAEAYAPMLVHRVRRRIVSREMRRRRAR